MMRWLVVVECQSTVIVAAWRCISQATAPSATYKVAISLAIGLAIVANLALLLIRPRSSGSEIWTLGYFVRTSS